MMAPSPGEPLCTPSRCRCRYLAWSRAARAPPWLQGKAGGCSSSSPASSPGGRASARPPPAAASAPSAASTARPRRGSPARDDMAAWGGNGCQGPGERTGDTGQGWDGAGLVTLGRAGVTGQCQGGTGDTRPGHGRQLGTQGSCVRGDRAGPGLELGAPGRDGGVELGTGCAAEP